ncbi:btk-binding protein-related [Holotrichia oblita]|uniref:Btk-binding protein-related n=1 Tax=Holotrichia oblita TaxID=644536 RepID=A0ACB9TP57_HOLOL|nr:btk-binding protein-related [Holotrichia oblita]
MDFCDCADKCKSKEHGNTLCSSLTKRDITDAELCAYFNQICFCCEAVRDAFGRTTLHLAASVGRANVVKWLLKRKQININARDFESGYTALHRSIFYGKINAAVALLHAGASNVLDHENLTCLDHAVKNHPFCPSDYDDGEVYVWGTNSNYIFGIQQARQTPDIWDIFHKEYPFELVKQINLGKFHCVVVTGNGNAYSCGHGQGGRLGIGSEQTILTPKLIKFTDTQRQSPIYCIQASIARDHTVFLAECDDSYQIWSCGLNTHHVLGINPPPSKQLTPKRLSHFKQLFDGVCAARYHSVAWGPKAIYTWGLHGGQLGHDQNTQKYIVTPKLITRLYKIKSDIQEVVVSSGATVVLLASGDLFVFHEYQCRILSARQKLSGVAVVGGRLNTSLDTSLLVEKNSELKILALTQHGKILLWQESDPHLVRCVLSLNREISVTQIYLNMCEILFVDNEGEAYQGTLKNRKKKSGESSSAAVRNTFHRFIERDECHFVKITKLPRIHKAISITSDSKGGNFAIIQVI